MDTQVANTRIDQSQRPQKPRHAKASTLWFDLRAITPGKDVAKPPRSDLRLMPVTHLGGCVLFRLQAAPRWDPSRRAFMMDARLGQTGAQTKRLLIRYGVRRWLSSVVSRSSSAGYTLVVPQPREDAVASE